jgi:LysM repeat protein
VRIEGTGEGVIAGRAAPGWTVQVESGGNVIAETKADAEGAWTVVLDKPLPAGDHTLSLKAVSPDGTSALTSQQPVKVAVGEAPGEKAAASPEEPKAVEGQPEPVVPDENAPPVHGKPPVKIGKLDYEDTGPDTGKISLSGVGDPNIRVFLFFDDQPLSEVTIGADGTWAIEIEKKLGEGEHTIRADTYDEKTGIVAGRASVRLGREPEAAPPSTEVSAAEPPSLASQPQPVYPEASAEPETPPAPTEPLIAASPVPGQPSTVYPEGEPPPSTTPPASPAADASTEFPSLASQPQPVVPVETAEAEPPQPSTPAVTAEPPGEATPAPARPTVVFRSVDYQDVGAESGKISLSGTGDPGARILLYFDGAPLGEVTVGSDGNWSFEADKKLETGEHTFRGDRLDAATGNVVGRAQIGMARMAPAPKPPKEEEVAAQEPTPAAPSGAAPEAKPGEEAAAAEEAKPAPAAKKKAQRPRRPRVYTVRRGDTLWEIAESYYGGGWHYRAIVRDNRRKIKSPHWIYPKQKFKMPRRG